MTKLQSVAIFFLSCFLIFNACKSSSEKKSDKPAFNELVSAFTSGVVSNESIIQVQFSKKVKGVEHGMEASTSLLKFKPDIQGKLVWHDAYTLHFIPTEQLPSGVTFKAALKLPKLFENQKEDFEFDFSSIEQNYRIVYKGLEPLSNSDLSKNVFVGRINLADHANDEMVEKIITAKQDGQDLEVDWTHYRSEKSHVFRIKNIVRHEKKSSFNLEHNGRVLGLDKKGSEVIDVPSLNDFKVVSASLNMHPNQHVLVTFSDPLNEQQNIAGLISIKNVARLRYEIDNNRVKVYPPYRLSGKKEVIVSQGIKNSLGYPLNEESRYELLFETPKPEISLIGKGTILPNSNGLIFPFKAVSLKAVEVRIIKIYESNVAHFLQVNRISGDNQLRRAGRLILRKTIRLDKDRSLDLSQWNNFSLDLTKLVQTEPGAIYRVELKMLKKHSIYPCGNEEEENDNELPDVDNELSEADMVYWDQPDDYYSSYWDGYESYNWRERDDPCSNSYYSNKVSVKNILASDIGIIAKKGNGKEILVAITDLRTTEPLTNARVEVLSYQNQLLAELSSDANGLAKIDLTQKPFLVVVKHNNQRGYLKLVDGNTLSYSRFDVDGQQVQKGMKGFLYGERGVWRPGDTIFVSFILQNKGAKLPTDHPVVFELQNPNGQVINRQVSSVQANHIISFRTQTSSDAPTGMWLARVKVGSSVFTKGLRIETVKPNRLKINLDFGTERLSPGSAANTRMQVNWLHGAVARNLDANVSVTLNQSKTTFNRYTDYAFDDPSRRFESEEIKVFDGQLNEFGQANIDAHIDVKEAAPGMLKASFLTRVFEESGDFSVDRFSLPYAPYNVFVGVKTPSGDKRNMLLTDTAHVVNVVTLDADGKEVDVKNLSYFIYKVSWRWWWESSPDNLANYVGTRHQNLITGGKLSTKNGQGQFSFKIKYPDWGRYLVRVVDNKNGHATGKTIYVDWPGWAGKRKSNDASSASMLTFTSDKSKYMVGEVATINFPSSANGRALLSIENGKGVLKSWWLETQDNNTSFNIDVTNEMTPNVYVSITSLQRHAQTVNDLPIRMYGVIPLMVEDPDTHLNPVISMPEELRPEQKVTISVSEKNDKAMTYTLALVEDGLLDLTRYKTPKPWYHFFAKEALGVRTWDLYDQVIGAYGGEIEQLFSIGGDDDMTGDKGAKKANRFKPVVKCMGPFSLEEGETVEHTINMPRYVGSVRTMIVAASENAFGSAEKTTPVRNPLMVLATLPRVLGPGEEVDLPVTVFAMKENIKNVELKLQTNSLFDVIGESKKNVNFENEGEQVVNFKIKVKSVIGIGNVKVLASSDGEFAEDEIELEVRNPNPRITLTKEAVIEAGQQHLIDYTLPGIAGTNHATLEVSNIPPIDFGRRLKYLLRYPHGCVEQTTSAAFPQLYLSDVLKQSDELEATIGHNIKGAIKKLEGFMRSDGGLSYWPGATAASDWGTSYAGHFLLEAELKGYQLPIGFKNKWLKYQKKTARQWSPNKRHRGYDLAQAYRLYTIALAGEPELSAMNRMRNQNSISWQARWRLAAAYALAGHQNVAQELVENSATSGTGHDVYTYGSADRDKAMVIETLTLMKKREKAAMFVQELSKALSGQNWMSTQTTAYSLLAISKFLGDSGSDALSFEWSTKGQKQQKVVSQLPIYQTNLNADILEGNIEVKNESEGLLFARIIMDGIPSESDQTRVTSNLSIDINYTDLLGNAIDVKNIDQGTDFMAIVQVRNSGIKGHIKDLALTQIFPSGWEIRNTRMEDISNAHEINQPDYRDYRDDRVYSYFDLRKAQTQKFVVLLNASYTGKYYLPAVSCEAMYDNAISARQPGMWVEVVKAGQ